MVNKHSFCRFFFFFFFPWFFRPPRFLVQRYVSSANERTFYAKMLTSALYGDRTMRDRDLYAMCLLRQS